MCARVVRVCMCVRALCVCAHVCVCVCCGCCVLCALLLCVHMYVGACWYCWGGGGEWVRGREETFCRSRAQNPVFNEGAALMISVTCAFRFFSFWEYSHFSFRFLR